VTIVAGVLAAWGEWLAPEGDALELARSLRHAGVCRPATLYQAYERLAQWGIDPLRQPLF
jgi:hypothetical protein